jgi:predicted phosphodiesterase
LGSVAGQTAVHYQPENFSTFTTDGLLARIYDSRTLLNDIEARSQQMEPFITSILTLSTELQETFVNPEAGEEIASKFLLVSDIHGVNQYAMLKKIIDEQGITAVIDTGDLVNFGYGEELVTSNLDSGIASLGVPYLFIKGNHDSSSPQSLELSSRLSAIDNVVLLQPDSNGYLEATINGTTIAGFNDPRYYGDSNTNNEATEEAAADRFNQSFADEPVPDIVATHSPLASQAIQQAGLTINGHMHRSALTDNHIQVGSFTGGGLFHHVPESEEESSINQPYMFDILAFDTSCQLQSLTRFSFRSIIQGKPQYDSVAYINGGQLGFEPDDNRSCGTEMGLDTRTIPAVDDISEALPPRSVPDTSLQSEETTTAPAPSTGN